MSQPTAPEALVRSYFASFDHRDPGLIAAHVSIDFVNEHTAGLGAGCVGRANYLDRLPGFLADMADLHYEIEELLVDSDRVAVFYAMSARWQDTTPFSVRGAQRLRISDGLISHRTDYWDSAVFLAQVSLEARATLEGLGITAA